MNHRQIKECLDQTFRDFDESFEKLVETVAEFRKLQDLNSAKIETLIKENLK